MERSSWTDERLDEKMASVDQTFERIFAELAGIREEMREMRREFHEEIRALRSDFASFQGRLTQIGFGLVAALVTSLVALVVALA